MTTKLIDDVMGVLHHPDFQPIFSENSRAEVSIAGHIKLKSGPRLISGQIDRMLITDETVWIIDYKTGRPAAGEGKGIGASYLSQLALYQYIVAQIYPNHQVKCALLWTEGPQLTPVKNEALERQFEAIINESIGAS